MDLDQLEHVAELVATRNAVDAEIAAITDRPVVAGHLGEWIASQVFEIRLEASATSKAIDGRFASGPLVGSTVNVKWSGKREGLLDLTEDERLDYYLVLAGPIGTAASSRRQVRPLAIEAVYLFDARTLLDKLRAANVRIGVASSVRRRYWDEAEIYPARGEGMLLSDEQRRALACFGPGGSNLTPPVGRPRRQQPGLDTNSSTDSSFRGGSSEAP